jgi:hypothetical protein
MATVLSYSTAKSMVISLLQASLTAYASAVDGSNRQFASDTEIQNAILTADLECAALIAKTPLHPYQTQFVATPAAAANGSNTPIRNGMILRVTGQIGAAATNTFLNTDISTSTDLVTKANHGLFTGQAVQLTTSGSLPTGLSLTTTYYISVSSSSTYGFSTTIYNAKAGTLIDITAQGSGTNTVTTNFTDLIEADSKDTITQMVSSPYLFASSQGITAGFWCIEGDTFYTSCPAAKIYYTDVTLTSSPQCPEAYLFAVVSGAMPKLLKDGGPADEIGFYSQQYQGYLQEIASNAKLLPEISTYTRQRQAA